MEPQVPRPDGRFATRAVHGAAALPDVEQRPLSTPIWPAVTWGTERSVELAELLDDEREGYVYGRYDNPTATALHAQIASLHGSEAAWSLASGTAAILATLEALRSGGRILASDRLYGGTWALLRRMTARAGWDVGHLDLRTPGPLADELARQGADLVYVETVANPSTDLVDLAALAEVTNDAGVPLVVDNTFASPYLCRPLELGATIAIESATKYLGGHGDVVAGVVAGPRALIEQIRVATYELGGSLGPFEAWLVARGIQTLPLRMTQASRNALAVARTLTDLGLEVRYPGLPSHPQHDLARRMFGDRGFGGVLSAETGDRDRAEAFADRCKVFTRAVSLGATHSLILHAASTTHRQLDDAALLAAGLGPGTVRLSCGIEDTDDLVEDVRQAWNDAKEPS